MRHIDGQSWLVERWRETIAAIRQRPLLSFLFAVLFVAQSVPIWVTKILPQGDIYQHLAIVEVIHNYHAPGSIYPELFRLPDFIKPNLLYYYAVDVLAYVFPIEVANKLILNLYVLLLPLSILYLLGVFDRPRRLALFAFILTYNGLFRTGYVGYLLSIPLYFFGIGLFYRFSQDLRWKKGAAVATLATTLFFTHAQMYLMFLLTVGVMALILWDGWRKFFLRAAAPAVSLFVFVPWFLRYFVFFTPASETHGFSGMSHGFGAFYHDPETLLSRFYTYILSYFRDSGDDIIALILVLFIFVGLALRGSRPAATAPKSKPRKPWTHRYLPELISLLIAITIFALPVHIKSQAVISVRHVTLFVLSLIPWLGWFPTRKASAAFAVALAALGVTQGVYVADHFLAYERELGGYEKMFDGVRPWSRLYKVSGAQLFSRVAQGNVFWHLHYNFMVWKGGITDVQFAEYVTCPVRYRPGVVPPKLPTKPAKSPKWRYYDYFLVQQTEKKRMHGLERWMKKIGETHDWILYEKRERPFERWWDLDKLAPPKRKERSKKQKAAEKERRRALLARKEKAARMVAPRALPQNTERRARNTLKPHRPRSVPRVQRPTRVRPRHRARNRGVR